jgi:tetratricopeptide (TPR) repeat protein
MCNAAYYLVEVGSTKELSKTVDSTMKGFKTTDLIHENPLAYAHICNSAALEREMSGDFSGAESLFKIAQEIRCRELPEGHEDIWAVMNNLGNLNLSLGNYAEALRFHLVCQQTIATSVKGNMMMNCINLGRCYTGLGRYTEAMGSFNRAKQYSPTAELSFR